MAQICLDSKKLQKHYSKLSFFLFQMRKMKDLKSPFNIRKRFDLPFSADEFNKWLYEARFINQFKLKIFFAEKYFSLKNFNSPKNNVLQANLLKKLRLETLRKGRRL